LFVLGRIIARNFDFLLNFDRLFASEIFHNSFA